MEVLDVGCGFGAGLARLADTCGASGVGVTSSPRQVAMGSKLLAGRPGVSLRLASFDDPLPGSFDVVIAVESLIHARSLPDSLAHIAKVLRPGGALAIVDDFWLRPGIPSPLVRDGWGVNELTTAAQLTVALEQAGLEVAAQEDWTGSVVGVSEAAARRARIALLALSRVWPSRRTLWRFYEAQLELHRCLAQGELRYWFVMARKPGSESLAH